MSNPETSNQVSRVAILDLGTNTFHLLIADIHELRPVIIHQDTIAVKLGEGGISRDYISPEAFDRGLKALKFFRETINQYKVTTVKGAATSAIRGASNGSDFIDKIKSETGLDLEIINGDREAELIYTGVKAAVNIEQVSLIVDIGGGSVEFIICDKTAIIWKKSYPIGAARLMEKFHRTDPISNKELSQINTYLQTTLTDLQEKLNLYRPVLMIGSAGSFETFAELQSPGLKFSFETPDHEINIRGFRDISRRIISSSHAERLQIPQIPAVRVDMIVVASILTNYILDIREFKSLKLSVFSLKEGLLFDMLK
ncbi:MAG: exopolyphosphatase [Bacteroidota bacterium]